MLGGIEVVRAGEEREQPLQVRRGTGPLHHLALAHHHGPVGVADPPCALAQHLQPSGGLGLGELRTDLERRQVGVDQVAVDLTDVLHRDTVDRADLGHHQVDQGQVVERDGQLVDHAAAPGLEDLDAEHVAAHRADAARHLTERSGAVREPDSQDDGGHAGDATDGMCPADERPVPRSIPRPVSDTLQLVALQLRQLQRAEVQRV